MEFILQSHNIALIPPYKKYKMLLLIGDSTGKVASKVYLLQDQFRVSFRHKPCGEFSDFILSQA
jgi:hypothetical protein